MGVHSLHKFGDSLTGRGRALQDGRLPIRDRRSGGGIVAALLGRLRGSPSQIREIDPVVRGSGRHRTSRTDRLHHLDFLLQPVCARPVRLVHHEQVGHFHQARLHRLDPVPGLGNQDDDRGIRVRRDLELRLTDPDGLQQDMVEAERVHEVRGLPGGRGQAAAGAPAGHGTNEDPGLRSQVVHAHPVAQQSAASERAAGIHRHDTHRLTTIAQVTGHDRRERGLPCPRRACDPGSPRPPYPGMQCVQQVLEPGGLVLDARDAASKGQGVARSEPVGQFLQRRRERTCGGLIHAGETAVEDPTLQEETATPGSRSDRQSCELRNAAGDRRGSLSTSCARSPCTA